MARLHPSMVAMCIAGVVLGSLSFLQCSAQPVAFDQNYLVTGGTDNNVKKLDGGKTVQLVLNQDSASGFASKSKYLFGHISMSIKLVPDDSAGTVTAFYMSSESPNHDELDFEFLGNSSGEPYILQTNVFASGIGNREQRIYLWFDPTADFHSYSVIWNPQQIIFKVDDVPIRVFKNNQASGLPYPSTQPMRIFSSLWNGDSWATRGGLQKLNWTHAPFIATYQGFSVDACQWSDSGSLESCATSNSGWWNNAAFQTLDSDSQSKLKWVQQNYMIYDYCTDTKRFTTTPTDCTLRS
ncbi:hypothetical protein O6H91_07G127800 [Diphasiastrum complanatum]|uniref:Uncharacterized protein n=2 Tax=Diphasiastrum complanatum TaxID=34168 RepID=A0ACC2D9U9_DIPCM|nr:hypothetical protein O6H91_07G127400 [Diphasiastrum complanatum]KAJ7550979.1 hypothetical protein O6H91_07G127800 [Diphasiastrum complanatum]